MLLRNYFKKLSLQKKNNCLFNNLSELGFEPNFASILLNCEELIFSGSFLASESWVLANQESNPRPH